MCVCVCVCVCVCLCVRERERENAMVVLSQGAFGNEQIIMAASFLTSYQVTVHVVTFV